MVKNEVFVIKKFCSNPSSLNMDELILLASKDSLSDDGIALLAKSLAESGKILKLTKGKIYSDIPSTGGPSSLSTLICPLVLANLNIYVPKLGVPGRPAGGIDVLSQIPGYRIFLSDVEISECLKKAKYCHFLVNDEFAPLDKIFFNYRSKVGAKDLAPLVIASILSKKIVAGLTTTGLDIRVSSFGNFGHTWEKAEANGKRFIEVAKKVGIKAKCYLGDNNKILQPYIGRGESLIALAKIFNKNYSPLLKDHLYKCVDMARNLAELNDENIFSVEDIYKTFEKNLIAQGASADSFFEKVSILEKQYTESLIASKNGFLNIDLAILRDTIVSYQGVQNAEKGIFNDSCGVIFLKSNNEYVEKGEVILKVRATMEIRKKFLETISGCYKITNYYQQSTEYQIIN